KILSSKAIAALTLSAAIAIPALLPAMASAQDNRTDHLDSRDGRDRRDDRSSRDNRDDRDSRRGNNDQRDHRGFNAGGDRRDDRGQDSKNEWRNLGVLGGAVGVIGLLSGDRNLAALGLGGGLYSAYRYEQDRRSENRFERNRYDLFNRSHFDYEGARYNRR